MIRCLVVGCLLLAAPAMAAEGEVIIPSAMVATRPVTMKGQKVIAYGPVAVPPQLQKTKDTIFVYMEGASFDGHAGSLEVYLAFPPKGAAKKTTPIRVDPGDYVSGEGAMEDQNAVPSTRMMELHNFEVKGAPFQALKHFQAASEVYVVLTAPLGHFHFDRVVITTQPPQSRPAITVPVR